MSFTETMKRHSLAALLFGIILVLISIVGLVGVVNANDLRVILTDEIEAADTAATALRYDTAYSIEWDIRGWTDYSFYSRVVPSTLPGDNDTNFTDDTVFVKFQHSFTGGEWRTSEVDTLFPPDSGWSVLTLSRADSALGNWGRAMFIFKDSTEATAPGLFGNTYEKMCELWISFLGKR
ncbi:MAG TPA: hypothetical protein VFI02_14075 [Armatimonadota bacterium]|nr:hypothetical protein [Armatimonadota bacterium]